MKTKKLLKRIKSFLNDEEDNSEVELEQLELLVDKLKKREKKLEAKLEAASGDGKKRVQKKLEVVRAHRKKGEKTLAELQEESDS